MRLPALERSLHRLVDLVYASWPRPRPARQALAECRIVAHRGAHDRRDAPENTLAAFAQAANAGVWGIEFDVRWTRDLEPVVIHDPDARRVFGVDLVVAEVELRELRERLPDLPTLAEVLDRFGGRQHLMIELKSDALGADARKRERLAQLLEPFRPGTDYHVLALQLELFELIDFIDERHCISVAELNVASMSRDTLARDLAGISGQYLLLSNALLHRHRRRGQRIGTGFVESRYVLYRELGRGVTWIFSNQAARLARIRRELLESDN